MVVNVGDFNLFEILSDVFVEVNFDNFLEGESSIIFELWLSFDYDKLFVYYCLINVEVIDKSIVVLFNLLGIYEVIEEVFIVYV